MGLTSLLKLNTNSTAAFFFLCNDCCFFFRIHRFTVGEASEAEQGWQWIPTDPRVHHPMGFPRGG
jgi:hypothetical protein